MGRLGKRLVWLLAVASSLFVLAACRPGIDPAEEKAVLLQVDRDCAAASVEAGFVAAYYRYLAEDGMVMPPGRQPLSGRDEIRARWSEDAGDEVLEWEPRDGDVSRSGDLGWTWGNWVFTETDEEGRSRKGYGKYVFIWKKVNGDWKIAANIWNDNPAPE